MANLSKANATTILRALGWRIRSDAEYVRCVKNFQAGWNLGAALTVDGSVGPATSAALLKSEANRKAGKGTASAHFDFTEVMCRCGGLSACQRIWHKRSAFRMMESYRSKSGRPFTVVSACRCPAHNKRVGGSPTSRHLTGYASDVQPYYSTTKVKSWQVATHIGYGSESRKVKHIDVGSGATRTNPKVYVDGR
jgi:zinc D-Ala-D-Ala carboxypeptidase